MTGIDGNTLDSVTREQWSVTLLDTADQGNAIATLPGFA